MNIYLIDSTVMHVKRKKLVYVLYKGRNEASKEITFSSLLRKQKMATIRRKESMV